MASKSKAEQRAKVQALRKEFGDYVDEVLESAGKQRVYVYAAAFEDIEAEIVDLAQGTSEKSKVKARRDRYAEIAGIALAALREYDLEFAGC